MIITKTLTDLSDLTSLVSGTAITSGTAGSNTVATTSFSDSSKEFGNAGVLAGDTLHIVGIGTFTIASTPGATATSVTTVELLTSASSGQRYVITRGHVPMSHFVQGGLVPTDSGYLAVYDPTDPVSGSDLTGAIIHGTSHSTGASIATQTNLDTACGNAANCLGAIRTAGFSKITLNILIQNAGSSTGIAIVPRFSSLPAPVPATENNWAVEFLEDSNASTGAGPLAAYFPSITYGTSGNEIVRMYGLTFPVRGTFFSPVVFAAGADITQATIYAIRLK